MLKNTDGQTFTCVAFNTSGKVTGNATAITCTLAIDGGTRVALGDTNPVEIGATGVYEFDLTQAETNGHELSFVPASSTSGVEVLGSPSNVIYTDIASLIPVVLPGGTLNPIIRGDDYTAANGRQFTWDFTPPDGMTVASGGCKFGASNCISSFLVNGTLSDIGGGEFRAAFDVIGSVTANLTTRNTYTYSVEAVNDAGLETTIYRGTVRLVTKHT